MSKHVTACLSVCALMYVCVPGPCMCVSLCMCSEPLPTITVSVHYSLGLAKIVINSAQRWTEGNERLVGGAAETRLVLLGQIAQHVLLCH